MPSGIDVQPPKLASFLEHVIEVSKTKLDRQEAIQLIHPMFKDMLSEPDWLANEYKVPLQDKFAQYLIYREADRSLSVMAMVIPVGTTTPVHNHLAWGLVGVYQGTQLETVYRRLDDSSNPEEATLAQIETNVLKLGDVTHLLPPDGDIHKIETLGEAEPSVSIHILGNDIGCQWRNAFDIKNNLVHDFRSGYINAPCED